MLSFPRQSLGTGPELGRHRSYAGRRRPGACLRSLGSRTALALRPRNRRHRATPGPATATRRRSSDLPRLVGDGTDVHCRRSLRRSQEDLFDAASDPSPAGGAMKHPALLALACCLVVPSGVSHGQQARTVTANQLRLDLRLLGHPPKDVIPPGESAITSLVIGADGALYGGTSGRRPRRRPSPSPNNVVSSRGPLAPRAGPPRGQVPSLRQSSPATGRPPGRGPRGRGCNRTRTPRHGRETELSGGRVKNLATGRISQGLNTRGPGSGAVTLTTGLTKGWKFGQESLETSASFMGTHVARASPGTATAG